MAKAIIIDRGWMKIKSKVNSLKGQGVKVGIRSTAGAVDGIRIVDYATWNEFGTDDGKIPSRPFMRRTADLSKRFLPPFVKWLVKQLIENKSTVDQTMNRLGLFFQSEIRKTIRSSKSWARPNSPITIARKKSSTPLIDTGAMINAVDYERTRI